MTIWQKLANRYKKEEFIAGYNLINEPVAPNGDIIVNIYNKIIKEIRKEDDEHLIFLDGNMFGTDFTEFNNIKDTSIVLCCHAYAEYGNSPYDALVKYNYVSENLNRPMWIGEWGSNSKSSIEHTIADFKHNSFYFCGWVFWTWKRIPMEKYPNPVVFNPNNEWNIITDLVNGNYNKKNSKSEILNALNGFSESIKFENSTLDSNLINILAK